VIPLAASILGTIPGWIAVAGVAIVSWLIWRGGSGTALDTLQTANRVLERRVHELEQQAKKDTAKIAELSGKTDMALAVKPFMEWATLHETRAGQRHEGIVAVLQMIADRLGAENEQRHGN
jgi:hypothetical protein